MGWASSRDLCRVIWSKGSTTGCNSLHRVSPIEGPTLRIMGLFVYEPEPGVVGDPEVNETIYGERVAL